jgi:hypothetical protein
MNTPLFFFTAEDPREIPKGSRDPLRFLPVWSHVARQMIPYLTTVTPSYRGFLTRYLFHAAIEELKPDIANASKKDQWEAFNKFEQLCAIVRSHSPPFTPDFPGKSNIMARNHNGRAVIGRDIDYWLMRSQENTGFWGYYHQASLGSGLLKHNSHPNAGYKLSPDAKETYERSHAKLLIGHYSTQLQQLFNQKKFEFEIADFASLARFFAEKPFESGSSDWKEFWHRHVLTPQPPSGDTHTYNSKIQQSFASSVVNALSIMPEANVSDIWEQLAQANANEYVAQHAQRIKSTEAIIGLCEWVFDACRLRSEGGENLSKASKWAQNHGYDELWLSKLRDINGPQDPDLQRYRDIALSSQDSFVTLAVALIQRHKNIMLQRKGSPWVELLDDQTLHVRETCSEPSLPSLAETSSGVRWRYDYFLGSWISVARELGYIREVRSE